MIERRSEQTRAAPRAGARPPAAKKKPVRASVKAEPSKPTLIETDL